ncbi:MAG: tyrosine-type recombinase/integrase, partial [Proteobacteria bacterium]|nr:tyrosine-type recombinase/integrase [Pseudomonadota bacterium]
MLVKEDYLEPDDIERADRRSTDIAVLLADFRRVLERRQTSTDHRTELDRALRAFVKETRVASPRDLDVHLIDHYLQRIRDDGKSARTFNHHRSALSAFCRWLVDYRYLDQNPVAVTRSMDHTKDRRRISRALTVDECDRLVAATICPTRQALYRFRMLTGVRCREAGRLLWRDIDLGDGTLHLRAAVTKNGKADMLPLAGDVCDLLAGLQRDAFRNGKPAQPDDPVFGPPPDRRTWARDLKRAGIETKTPDGQADPKCLRPTFNSHLERSG